MIRSAVVSPRKAICGDTKAKTSVNHTDREDIHCVYEHSRSIDRKQNEVSCTGSTGLASPATSNVTTTYAELVYFHDLTLRMNLMYEGNGRERC